MSRKLIDSFQTVRSLSRQEEVHFSCHADWTKTVLTWSFCFRNESKCSLCFLSRAIACNQHQGSLILNFQSCGESQPSTSFECTTGEPCEYHIQRQAVVYYALAYQGSNQIISQWGYGCKQTMSLAYIICSCHCLLG